jgi:DNA-directed RNA polymerase subunit N
MNGFYKAFSGCTDVLVPVRCFTCGNLIADKYQTYVNRVKAGEDSAKVMDDLGLKRYCCRRMFVATVETIYQVLPYYEALRRRKQEVQSELE